MARSEINSSSIMPGEVRLLVLPCAISIDSIHSLGSLHSHFLWVDTLPASDFEHLAALPAQAQTSQVNRTEYLSQQMWSARQTSTQH